jgi:hypothetical protein
MHLLVDVVWNNQSLRTASTMHIEPLGGCCMEQYGLENYKYNELLGGCCLEQSVLENCKYNELLGGCCLEQYVLENCKYNVQ